MTTIGPANLDSVEFVELIRAHKALMLSHSPPESSHALLIDGLKAPDISVFEMRDGGRLVGCGALKELDARHGEIKSMHTVASERGKGHGRAMLEHLLGEAKARGYTRVSLETGWKAAFEAPRTLYASAGFSYCGPFGAYADDPHSVFMTLELKG